MEIPPYKNRINVKVQKESNKNINTKIELWVNILWKNFIKMF